MFFQKSREMNGHIAVDEDDFFFFFLMEEERKENVGLDISSLFFKKKNSKGNKLVNEKIVEGQIGKIVITFI